MIELCDLFLEPEHRTESDPYQLREDPQHATVAQVQLELRFILEVRLLQLAKVFFHLDWDLGRVHSRSLHFVFEFEEGARYTAAYYLTDLSPVWRLLLHVLRTEGRRVLDEM